MKYIFFILCLVAFMGSTNAQCVDMVQKPLSNITVTMAKVNWATLPDTVLAVRVAYRKVVTGTSLWTYVLVPNVDSSYAITGLSPGTQYGVRVSSKCTPNVFGKLTAERRFTTLPPMMLGIPNTVNTPDVTILYFDMRGRCLGASRPTTGGIYVERSSNGSRLIQVL